MRLGNLKRQKKGQKRPYAGEKNYKYIVGPNHMYVVERFNHMYVKLFSGPIGCLLGPLAY